MSRKCYVTGKGPKTGNKRSHALNKTKKSWGVNVQKSAFWLTASRNVYMFLHVPLNPEKSNVCKCS